MSKSVRLKDLTDKFHSDWENINISAAYFIVWTDKIFKISWNDWHVQKDFINDSGDRELNPPPLALQVKSLTTTPPLLPLM